LVSFFFEFGRHLQSNVAFSLDNSLSGLLIALMYGQDWRFKIINGIVWMQGLKSIDWANVSVRALSSTGTL
jgi:hypothetical protein